MKKFDPNLYLQGMYQDDYYPRFLVDKVKAALVPAVDLLESGERDMDKIQAQFDTSVNAINDLVEEFYDNDSEIETVARDDIAITVEHILRHFELVDPGVRVYTSKSEGIGDKLLRNRDW